MKTLLRLAKKSAKESYKQIREKSPFFCGALEKEVQVSKIFFNHIVYHNSKNREEQEIIERILIFPFLNKIFKNGKLTKKRTYQNEGTFFHISLPIGKDIFAVIVLEKENNLSLVSCFREYDLIKTKKDLS